MAKWSEGRPRWGTLSVKSHLNLDALAMDLLLYDALIFPTPSDEAEADRWDREGWDTAVLARRVVQLGDLAYTAPWDDRLRSIWRGLFEERAREHPDQPALGFDLTAAVMADEFFLNLVAPDDDRVDKLIQSPELLPAFAERDARKYAGGAMAELIAAHHDVDEAQRVYGIMTEIDPQSIQPPDQGFAIGMQLVGPADVQDEEALFRVLKLVEDRDFQLARQRLWGWEEECLVRGYTPHEAAFALDRMVVNYNAEAERQLSRTRLRNVFYVVPLALGVGLDVATSGWVGKLLGVVTNVSTDLVKAKFPRLSEKGEPLSHHPGSAVAGALSVLAHD